MEEKPSVSDWMFHKPIDARKYASKKPGIDTKTKLINELAHLKIRSNNTIL